MKICLVAPVSRWRGGIHQYSVHLANHLAKTAEVEVVSYKSIFPRWFHPGKVRRVSGEVPVSGRVAIHEILKYYSLVSSFRAARVIHHRIRADVVDIQWFVPQHGFVLIPLILLLKFCFRSKATIFLTVHNVWPHEKRVFDRLLSRLAFRFSDRLLVHAESLRDEAVKDFGEHPRKIAVVPHGICADAVVTYEKTEARARLGIQEKYVLLFFGFVRPYKGLHDLIEAFQSLAEKYDVALLIAGEFFSGLAECREELRSKGLLRRTYLFPRYIRSEEIPVFFSAADLLVQPYTQFSGQSGVSQTAYLHSVAIVATDVGGLPELVIHGKTGTIVHPKDPKGLALGIETLLADEEKRRQYGAQGKRFLETELAWDRVTQTLVGLYAEPCWRSEPGGWSQRSATHKLERHVSTKPRRD
jgi:glycosyltransferase involved in cell wall biosynthesis